VNGYKPHPPLAARLIGYDPHVELASDHLCRFVDQVVDKHISIKEKEPGPGQPEYDPRALLKVLLYGYITGVFSSRRLAQNCFESLPYILLVRDDRPSYKVISDARTLHYEELCWLWYCLFDLAVDYGLPFLGKISIDSCKFKADVSKESVIRKGLYAEMREKLEGILAQAISLDASEDEECLAVRTRTGVESGSIQMREILREIRKDSPKEAPKRLSKRMVKRVGQAVDTLRKAEEEGSSHVSLTDPDARMMGLGSSKTIAMGHSLEVAAESGILVHSAVIHQSADTGRLPAVVEEAAKNSPAGLVTQVVADSGYYNGSDIVKLQDAGIQVVVPDACTACDLKNGDPVGTSCGSTGPQILFKPVEGRNAYICPQGNILLPDKKWVKDGRNFATYKAKNSCLECPLASICLKQKNAKYRTIRIGDHQDRLREYLTQFDDEDFLEIYHRRGPCVETVFALIRRTIGFDRWHVRGSDAIKSEAMLVTNSYQIRKLYKHWAAAPQNA
jgi:transposase